MELGKKLVSVLANCTAMSRKKDRFPLRRESAILILCGTEFGHEASHFEMLRKKAFRLILKAKQLSPSIAFHISLIWC
jgi:hypothetical protein